MKVEKEMNLLRRFSIGDVSRRHAALTPRKLALIYYYPDGKMISYTFKEFNKAINKLANALLDYGVKRGDKVSIYSLSCPQVLILTYALCKIGAAIAPISPTLRGKDLLYIAKRSDAKMLFVEDTFLGPVNEVLSDLKGVQNFGFVKLTGKDTRPDGWLDIDELISKYPDVEPEVEVNIEDIASLTFTSGTEAFPKGVMLTHGNYYAASIGLVSPYYGNIKGDDVYLCVLPLFYTGGLGTAMQTLIVGGSVLLTYMPDPTQMVELIPKHRVSLMVCPPTLYVRLLQVPTLKDINLSLLRRLITFGAVMPEGMISEWNKIAPHIEWGALYASSELSILGCGNRFYSVDEVPEGDMAWVGRPAPPIEMKLFDDNDQEVAVEEVGEMVFRGPGVFKGYYKDEDKNREIFRNGWFHSGDLGRMNKEGEVFFVDRKKDMVKSGGENISCASVELVVSSHPKVAEVAAFGVPHPDWMEALTVAVTPIKNEILTEEEIIQYCKQNLPRFKVPKYVRIVDDFPRNPTGKILKRELRAMYKDLASQK